MSRPNYNKTTGQSYSATEWGQLKSKCNSPGISKAFSESITADDEHVYADQTMNGDWNFVKDAGVVDNEGLFNGVSFKFTYQSGTINFTSDFDVISDALEVDEKYLMVMVWYGLSFSVAYKKFAPAVVPVTPIWQTASFEVGNVADNILVLPVDVALDTGSVPAVGDFAILVDAAPNVVTNVSLSTANQVRLTLTTSVTNGQAVTAAYTAGANPIRSNATQTNAADFTATAVTNNVSIPYPTFTNTHSLVIDETGEGDTTVQNDLLPTDGAGNDQAQSYELWYRTGADVDTGGILMQISDAIVASKVVIGFAATGTVYYRKRESAGNEMRWEFTSITLAINTWYQIIVTDDGLNTAGSVKIYLDAVSITISDSEAGTYNGLTALSGDLDLNIPYSGATVFGAGKYNLYRQFSYEMLGAQVTNLYNSGVPKGLSTISNCLIEKRFNNNHDAAIGADGSAVGTPTFDTDIPT